MDLVTWAVVGGPIGSILRYTICYFDRWYHHWHTDNFHLGCRTKVQGRSTPSVYYTWRVVFFHIQTISHAGDEKHQTMYHTLSQAASSCYCGGCVLRFWVHLTTLSHRIILSADIYHSCYTFRTSSVTSDDSHTLFSPFFDLFSLPHYLALHEQMKGLPGYPVTCHSAFSDCWDQFKIL